MWTGPLPRLHAHLDIATSPTTTFTFLRCISLSTPSLSIPCLSSSERFLRLPAASTAPWLLNPLPHRKSLDWSWPEA